MTFFPSSETFCAGLEQGRPQLVWTTLITDLDSPVSMMLKLMDDESCIFLLESVWGGESRGRYSIIAINPDLIWRCKGDLAEMSPGDLDDTAFAPCEAKSLPSLKKLLRESQLELPPELPPMSAGLIGFMGYGMVTQMEAVPHTKPDPINIPDGCFMRPRVSVIHDSVDGVTYIAAPVWDTRRDAAHAYAETCDRINVVLRKLQQPLAAYHTVRREPEQDFEFSSNFTLAEYKKSVETAKEYIRAGEIFQVVAAQRFQTEFALSPFALYRALRHTNPSPFLFYLHFGHFTLIGSSPEILVRLRDGRVTIRPIAGTRPRGRTPEADHALAEELLADPKERAEHLMLLDLGRNDVGRIAKPGTVDVTEQMIVERYSHVMHIVSNVEGELRDGCDAVDALMAGFPAGTVSGAPKIRAMEIIDELEPESRSFYAGCVGYFSANGSMDTCITLRTGLIKDDILYVQAGGGIVADSDPQAEYEESCNKARALMKAASIAHNFG